MKPALPVTRTVMVSVSPWCSNCPTAIRGTAFLSPRRGGPEAFLPPHASRAPDPGPARRRDDQDVAGTGPGRAGARPLNQPGGVRDRPRWESGAPDLFRSLDDPFRLVLDRVVGRE